MKFGALNIVTAVVFVFVLRQRDSLLQRETLMNQEEDQVTFDELREVFRSSKKERGGKITERACRQVLESKGITHLETLGLTVAKVMGLFNMMEADAHHRKDVDEFLFLLAHSRGDPTLMLASIVKHENARVLNRIDKMTKMVEIRFAQVLQEDAQVLAGRILP